MTARDVHVDRDTGSVEVVTAVGRLGGITSRKPLLRLVTRGDLERSVAAGDVVRVARGRYALPTDDRARHSAQALTGTAVLVTAAAHWGWARMWEPRQPQVAVPRGRNVDVQARAGVELRWRDLPRQDVVDQWVTTRERTLLDCAALLPFDQALAITDSALRDRSVSRSALLARAAALPHLHRGRAEKVFTQADPLAANPFESALRAIALEVPGLEVRCQVRIDDEHGWVGRVDLADESLRIVIEADSMEYHGEREAMDRDVERYTRLGCDGWLVLRFTWYHVMTRPDWVAAMLAKAVAQRVGRAACG
jgi:very-short-patch-repair endonuclease